MPFNVLLLPLLGGYVFISHWNKTRFDARRYTGQRLIFTSALAGVCLLLVSFLITKFGAICFPEFLAWWHAYLSRESFAGTSFLAFLIGSLGWKPVNLFFDRNTESLRTVKESGDFLEELLEHSKTETKQVSVTLRSGKIYVGFVTGSFDPAFDRKYVRLFTTLSGYRESTTQQMKLSHNYAIVWAKELEEEELEEEELEDSLERLSPRSRLVIPVSEIVSASLFEPEVYMRFQRSALDQSRTDTLITDSRAHTQPQTRPHT